MRFQLTHKLMTYLLALAALATLWAASLINGGVTLAAIAVGALSFVVDPRTRLFGWVERATPALRLLATLFFAFTAYRVWRRLPEPDLTPILNLVVFLTVYKLLHRSANRDYLQIYVLSFLMVIAGAAFAQSFVFVPLFVVYVVLTTWTLILLHLRREMEDNYLIKHAEQVQSQKVGVARVLNSRRVIGTPFLVATAGVALAVVAGATLTFAFVPRVGTGFAFGGQRARRTLIGFSDEVMLGTSGFLSDENDTVALRAVLPRLDAAGSERAREAELDHLYWRGTVYDRYDHGRWLRSRSEALRTHIVEGIGPALIREPHLGPRSEPGAPLAGTERQEIDIVGVSTPVAFALDRPVAFELPPPKFGTLTELHLFPRWSGEVSFRSAGGESGGGAENGAELHAFAGAHYVAYSRDPMSFGRAANGRPMAEIPAAVMAPYLTVPESLAPRLAALAQTVTAGKATAIAKVIAVTTWLDATHEYTTKLDRRVEDGDPVEDFLFERRSGHCEYFASAAALMLRASGVPTRYVNGFLGGEWNAVGHYVTVRQNRAHAWVEAYLGELGWMRVDATPPVRSPGRMGRLRQLLDSVDFLWGRWVVGYDLGRQIDIARNFGRGLGLGSGSHDDPSARQDRRVAWSPRAIGLRLGLAAAVLGVAWALLRRRRRASASGVPAAQTQSAIGRLYGRCLDGLAEGGHPRRPTETPREFARRIEDEQRLPGTAEFREVTELYLQTRFGRESIAEGLVAGLARRLARLGWLKRVSRRPPQAA